MNFSRFARFSFLNFFIANNFHFQDSLSAPFCDPPARISDTCRNFLLGKKFNFAPNFAHFRAQCYKIPPMKFCDFEMIFFIANLFHFQLCPSSPLCSPTAQISDQCRNFFSGKNVNFSSNFVHFSLMLKESLNEMFLRFSKSFLLR